MFFCSSHTAFRKVLPLLKIVSTLPCSWIGLAKRFSNAGEPFKQALQFFASFDELPTEIPTAAKPKDSCCSKNDLLKSAFKQSPLSNVPGRIIRSLRFVHIATCVLNSATSPIDSLPLRSPDYSSNSLHRSDEGNNFGLAKRFFWPSKAKHESGKASGDHLAR